MSPFTKGSAAAARRAVPRSAVRSSVLRCAAHLRHAANLAELAAAGPDPVDGAEYVLLALSNLREELAEMRSAALSRPR